MASEVRLGRMRSGWKDLLVHRNQDDDGEEYVGHEEDLIMAASQSVNGKGADCTHENSCLQYLLVTTYYAAWRI